MQTLIRVSGISALLASAVVLAGCASSGKQVKAGGDEVTVTATAPVVEKDALGNYRFLMQQGEKRMSADQFDAWMKANGIRVAKGAPAPATAAAAKPAKN
ncbi:hypothetical protein [Stenotrophomonas sp. SY1]|jgi:hypothetical protein|uniref:hypothetical protein n=1 Tax=Stenotrophomonas sp. SY1 TaxID=477235 RepID=UPI001E551406|nr:hypothetical protein [Stenotrophomonas sp. SY1]MCD9087935.1 hypothetical protein [Stenotrophomonas sp. SY1]